MKYLFVNGSLGFGGAERVTTVLCNRLAEDGNEVCILVTETQPITGYQLSPKIKLISLYDNLTRYKIRQIGIILEVRKFCKKNRPDIVICFYNALCALVSAGLTGLHIPLIYSERNDPKRTNQRKIDKFYRAVVERKADYFVFQTAGAKKCYPEFVQKKSSIILNPVSVAALPYRDLAHVNNTIVTIGRLTEQKNQQLLIDAFSCIADEYPNMALKIYGVGNLQNELEQQIAALGLADRVALMGATTEAHKVLSEARLFVLSSDYEGIPNVLVEAMTIGVPSISTDCSPGGAAELIQNGKNGLLVPCGNPDQLADAMRTMLNNTEFAESMGNCAIALRDRVDIESVYMQWKQVFLSIL